MPIYLESDSMKLVQIFYHSVLNKIRLLKCFDLQRLVFADSLLQWNEVVFSPSLMGVLLTRCNMNQELIKFFENLWN